ncbi:unnamed protein product [Ectocarpus sp. 8 AP-2014]
MGQSSALLRACHTSVYHTIESSTTRPTLHTKSRAIWIRQTHAWRSSPLQGGSVVRPLSLHLRTLVIPPKYVSERKYRPCKSWRPSIRIIICKINRPIGNIRNWRERRGNLLFVGKTPNTIT